ncbi:MULTISPECIES: hypothetical protein [Methylomonas]|uniref:Uncharacterized protein n=1 Tax=Methylomonas koyamae TaxID=702114 RepID=A0A177MZQ3_9GAMM|nr:MULTISPECIES: hypothetical protein [Methylomonas]ANE56516.1 hypothetical protein AYM39_15925 [Methylomonas sp. DH-1]ATG91480.1 hypothetical protein MKLM6_3289 [Methylomonas koyamae]OAI10450.1 hypothetical protein A1507_03975 [Methylomonas koyamae]BBL59678.1 hypothetical protein MKFW12EY_32910 [Methylomonas koyamae]
MILFFKDIPVNSRPNELYSLIASAGGEADSGEVLKAEVMVIRDKTTNALEHHGLAMLDSEQSGLRAIERLNGKAFNGSEILVRPYNFRDDLNDRRRGCEEDVAAEQRQRERRRGDRIEIFIDLSNIFFAPDPLL